VGVVGATAWLAAITADTPDAQFTAPILAGTLVLSCGMLATAFVPALAGTGSLATVMTLSAGISTLTMLLDMRKLMDRAREEDDFDPIGQSLLIHVDTLELFSRVAVALEPAKKRKR
jgi:predicted permease